MLFVFDVRNKWKIIPEFSLEITQFDFSKRGGRDEVWTESLSWDKSCCMLFPGYNSPTTFTNYPCEPTLLVGYKPSIVLSFPIKFCKR